MSQERVNIIETDNTKASTVNNNTLLNVFAGYFQKGQAFTPIVVTDEYSLVDLLGSPVATGNETNQIDFYTVLDHLKYSSPVAVVRTISATDARNASAFVTDSAVNAGSATNYVKRYNDEVSPVVYNASAYDFQTIIYCAYPAVYGNSIYIALGNVASTASGIAGKTFGEIFSGVVLSTNELYLVIGTSSSVYEKFIVSKNKYAKDEGGNSLFIDEVLKKSTYIRSYSNPDVSGLIAPHLFTATALGGGNSAPLDQSTESTAFVNGLDQLLNKDQFNIHLFIDKHTNTNTIKAKIIDFCGYRGDCTAVIAPNISTSILYDTTHTPSDLNTYYSSFDTAIDGAVSSSDNLSYAITCLNFKIQKDKYNDVYFVNSYVGAVAGMIAQSNSTKGFGIPVAGLSNGQILDTNVIMKKWSEDDRKVFAGCRINPIIKMQKYSDYPMLYDFITMLNKDSILNKAHARLISNRVKKLIRKNAFETVIFNKLTDANINMFMRRMDSDLGQLKGKELVDYRIENNTSSSDLDNAVSRFLIGIKIPNIIREIICDINTFNSDVNISERLS